MLTALSIRDIVLIDQLNLDLAAGLNVLTGETGAGKSILLDALGLAIGGRADKGLVRVGQERGSVSAEFEVNQNHPAVKLLVDHDLGFLEEVSKDRVSFILRRVQTVDGRARAYINDQPVSVALLGLVGNALLEVHGQHDDRGLLNATAHRALLDSYGQLNTTVNEVRTCHQVLREANNALEEARAGIADASAQADYYRHVLEELRNLDPQSGEEEALSTKRTLMMNAEKIVDDLNAAAKQLDGGSGIVRRLSGALRRLEDAAERSSEILLPAIEQVDRAISEAHEAQSVIENTLRSLEFDQNELENTEERLFALRAAGRKHNVTVDHLEELMKSFEDKLDQAEMGEMQLDRLEEALEAAKIAYAEAANKLSDDRKAAAVKLNKAIAKELSPLKLDKATFHCAVEKGDVLDGNADGIDRIQFLISTNPGTPLAPMIEIASGGELARFILALKVALARRGEAGTLIFDEVDQGVGGAVADAVGERLARLSKSAQVLVVTHSPQVAARAENHWRISKSEMTDGKKRKSVVTRVDCLDEKGHKEEVARMLAGAEVTEEARAAAERLISPEAQP